MDSVSETMRQMQNTILQNSQSIYQMSQILKSQQNDLREYRLSHSINMDHVKMITTAHERGQAKLQKDLKNLNEKLEQVELDGQYQDIRTGDLVDDVTKLQEEMFTAKDAIASTKNNITVTVR